MERGVQRRQRHGRLGGRHPGARNIPVAGGAARWPGGARAHQPDGRVPHRGPAGGREDAPRQGGGRPRPAAPAPRGHRALPTRLPVPLLRGAPPRGPLARQGPRPPLEGPLRDAPVPPAGRGRLPRPRRLPLLGGRRDPAPPPTAVRPRPRPRRGPASDPRGRAAVPCRGRPRGRGRGRARRHPGPRACPARPGPRALEAVAAALLWDLPLLLLQPGRRPQREVTDHRQNYDSQNSHCSPCSRPGAATRTTVPRIPSAHRALVLGLPTELQFPEFLGPGLATRTTITRIPTALRTLGLGLPSELQFLESLVIPALWVWGRHQNYDSQNSQCSPRLGVGLPTELQFPEFSLVSALCVWDRQQNYDSQNSQCSLCSAAGLPPELQFPESLVLPALWVWACHQNYNSQWLVSQPLLWDLPTLLLRPGWRSQREVTDHHQNYDSQNSQGSRWSVWAWDHHQNYNSQNSQCFPPPPAPHCPSALSLGLPPKLQFPVLPCSGSGPATRTTFPRILSAPSALGLELPPELQFPESLVISALWAWAHHQNYNSQNS